MIEKTSSKQPCLWNGARICKCKCHNLSNIYCQECTNKTMEYLRNESDNDEENS